MGLFSQLIEAIRYIRKHGWSEYCKARERYDRLHVDKKDYTYSKVGEIKQSNAIRKSKK